jgi:tRNA pseudouridine13 synthase
MLAASTHFCPLSPLHPLPRLTAGLPGCGGQIRTIPEEFVVEELPLYLPSGQGDHLYLWIEKLDVAAESLRRHLSRALGVRPMDIGMAGLKDKRALTRQWISVPRSASAQVDALDLPGVKVLQVVPHRNKLRTGHLAGNRFSIVLRGVVPDAQSRVQAKLAKILAVGLPNFFGSQRFGHGGSTLAAGWALAEGHGRVTRVRMSDDTEHVLHLADHSLRRLAASALQAEVFNRTLAARLAAGTYQQVLAGDICRKRLTGGQFVSEDPVRDQERLAADEIDLTGPMWGPKMSRPSGTALEVELACLTASGLTEAHFAALGAMAEGTRRPLRVPVTEVSVVQDGDALTVAFVLPAGSFATGLLHELSRPLLPLDGAVWEAEQGAHSVQEDDDSSVQLQE